MYTFITHIIVKHGSLKKNNSIFSGTARNDF